MKALVYTQKWKMSKTDCMCFGCIFILIYKKTLQVHTDYEILMFALR